MIIGTKTWRGTDINGDFWQTCIHDPGDGVSLGTGITKRQAEQMGFKSLEDMHDFLNNKKRKR